jgi:hypothetical protein
VSLVLVEVVVLGAGERATFRQQQLQIIQGVEEFCTSMQAALKTTDFDLKQKVLQLVIDRVTVDDQQLTIRHGFVAEMVTETSCRYS